MKTRGGYQITVNMSSQEESVGSEDGSQQEEVKSRLSDEPEMCQEDYEFFEWADICECPRPITMDECDCQAYRAYRGANAAVLEL
jgi:hypothetical protein